MQADGFGWWLKRLGSQLALFDLVRIDHFRGFEAYWEIPGKDKDARNGRWVKAPGRALLDALFKAYHPLPIVAENLGLITEEVEALRLDYQLPGMLVLQFAFDGNPDNPHLPENHQAVDVVYTGTHDNDTSLGWYQQLDDGARQYINDCLEEYKDVMPWSLIRAALASDGQLSIVPLQDFLELGNEHRMNLPGTAAGTNWRWRFSWSQFPDGLAARIRQLNKQYQRLP
jgi:4-alpha-glucanotransferase